MQFLTNINYDFLGKRKIAFVISTTLILISIVSLILHGGPKYSIDFEGGSFLHVKFTDKADSLAPVDVSINKVRESLAGMGLGKSEIKHFGGNQEIGIRVSEKNDSPDLAVNVISRLHESFPQNNIIEMSKDTVSAKVGKELIWIAIKAILIASIFILIYVMFRFQLRFSVGAVVALFHDIIITMGIFSVFNIEVSLPVIAALLTIVGYSLNDTIVVYDRIRENMKSLRKNISLQGLVENMNLSVNETLSRTIITSLTTLVVVLVLLVFGGEVLFGFSLALSIGILVGSYSSIFVASPVVLEIQKRKLGHDAAASKSKKR